MWRNGVYGDFAGADARIRPYAAQERPSLRQGLSPSLLLLVYRLGILPIGRILRFDVNLLALPLCGDQDIHGIFCCIHQLHIHLLVIGHRVTPLHV